MERNSAESMEQLIFQNQIHIQSTTQRSSKKQFSNFTNDHTEQIGQLPTLFESLFVGKVSGSVVNARVQHQHEMLLPSVHPSNERLQQTTKNAAN